MTVVLRPSEEEWSVIKALLDRANGSAVVIAPDVAAALAANGQELPADGSEIGYDFGGEPDVLVDVVTNADHYLIKGLFPSWA